MVGPSVPASEWGRRLSPGYQLEPIEPTKYAVVHHTAGTDSTDLVRVMRDLDAQARRDGEGCVNYSFAHFVDGQRAEGRGWRIKGTHTGAKRLKPLPVRYFGRSYNTIAHGLVAVGYFHPPVNDSPTLPLLQALAQTIADGVNGGHLLPDFEILGHRDTKSTACPGNGLYREIPTIDRLARALLVPGPPPPPVIGPWNPFSTPQTGSDDMVLSPQPGTPAGRRAYAKLLVGSNAIGLYNGASVDGDAPLFPGIRIWKPVQPHVLDGCAPLPDGTGIVASASDGGTFDAKWRR